MMPRQREREEGSRRDFTGVAIAPRGREHLPPPFAGSCHPSSSGPTQASATTGGAGRRPQRTLLSLPICYSLDGAATTEPGAWAAGRAGAGHKQDRGQQGRYFCRISAGKPSTVDPEDLPCGSRLGIFKSGWVYPAGQPRPAPPASASQRQARHFSNPLLAANQDRVAHSSPDRF
ncbi:unnamed protein product [Rangifer tarandus platyrhynchus]|uniref:Uncharacterized protein n=2 Tax=Rangifer tarandus platyrhynchus TaxID=3082113 RepID=A0ACB0EEI6_RANTA|nr:unnamed protein product [Rangifer tarandus platyrhynchus]CAI9698701.1 unnamed protein product [Rangifer tarandus platyrhynchus]